MLQTNGNKLTWLGHSTFKITTATGETILVDPWVKSNPMCPEAMKSFDRVDTLLISHGHFDHIADAVDLARQHKPKVVAIYETCVWMQSKGVENTFPMNKGGSQRVGDILVTMVNAIHSCGITDGDKIIYGGEASGFVIHLPGNFKVYHAGDTAVFGDMRLIAELYAPDLVLLPIGDHFTMGPREASYALKLLGARHVIPMHFGTFPALSGTPEKLREATRDLRNLEIHALKPGETIGG